MLLQWKAGKPVKKKKKNEEDTIGYHSIRLKEKEELIIISRSTDLFFVEHGNLNKNKRVSRVTQLNIVFEGLPFVTVPLSKQLDEDDDQGHVNPLYEQHYRHPQTYQQQEEEEMFLCRLNLHQTHSV
ncbi:hypothetical protein HanRHA438_Chr14g0637411 [Helianthus annuus]|nr:hypothetical protein HanRHA438_Chr14g0637411 [Helianthus annuus]